MGQKVNPTNFRIGHHIDWQSHWFSARKYAQMLQQDYELRRRIMKKVKDAGVAKVEITRSAKQIVIKLHSSRPGMIIGRGGQGVDELKKEIQRFVGSQGEKMAVQLDIVEIKNPGSTAQIVADGIVEQIEKRVRFRRILKQVIESTYELGEVEGVKIGLSGRLDGAEMSRREWLSKGNIPLHTIRADVDFARSTAFTTYGTIGVKVWIYRGEVFGHRSGEEAADAAGTK